MREYRRAILVHNRFVPLSAWETRCCECCNADCYITCGIGFFSVYSISSRNIVTSQRCPLSLSPSLRLPGPRSFPSFPHSNPRKLAYVLTDLQNGSATTSLRPRPTSSRLPKPPQSSRRELPHGNCNGHVGIAAVACIIMSILPTTTSWYGGARSAPGLAVIDNILERLPNPSSEFTPAAALDWESLPACPRAGMASGRAGIIGHGVRGCLGCWV